jgi:hypothetical protein
MYGVITCGNNYCGSLWLQWRLAPPILRTRRLEFEVRFEQLKQFIGAKSNTDLMQSVMGHFENTQYKSTTSNGHKSDINITHTSGSDTDDYFICSKSQVLYLLDICNGLGPLHCDDYAKTGHVGKFLLKGSRQFLFWNSSPTLREDFVINYKMVHAYLCSGMTPVQYERLSNFAGIGLPTQVFRERAVSSYAIAVQHQRDKSIDMATKEETDTTDNGNKGLVIMTDARHGCRTNSIHSDVLALGYNTHKVIGYSHVNKQDEPSSQKHELFGVKKLYEDFERRDLSVYEHVHDRNTSVTKYIRDEHREIKNSYDTWHATKEVRKHLKQVSSGPRRKSGIVWHP